MCFLQSSDNTKRLLIKGISFLFILQFKPYQDVNLLVPKLSSPWLPNFKTKFLGREHYLILLMSFGLKTNYDKPLININIDRFYSEESVAEVET